MSLRSLHRALGALLAVPLLVTATSGLAWTLQVHWLGYDKSDAKDPIFGIKLMSWHQGDVFFGNTKAYRLEYMWGILILFFTHWLCGLAMLERPSWVKKMRDKGVLQFSRKVHHGLAILVFLVLGVVAFTGPIYRILRLQGFKKDQVFITTPIGYLKTKDLMDIHQGYFKTLIPIFPILVGIITIIFTIAGVMLIGPTSSIVKLRKYRSKSD